MLLIEITRGLNESFITNAYLFIIKLECGRFVVLDWITTTEVDLRGFKYIPHEPHHESILLKSRFYDSATGRRSERDLIIEYKVELSAYAITTLGYTRTNCD